MKTNAISVLIAFGAQFVCNSPEYLLERKMFREDTP
jgi:hypothetical protein